MTSQIKRIFLFPIAPIRSAVFSRFYFLFALFLLSGCHPTPKADFTFINGPEPETIDPTMSTGQPESRLCRALFEGLTARDAHGIARPAVAEYWDISPDGKTYTFHLRPDIKWSDGSQVTAYDFEYAWHRALNPLTSAKYAEIFFFIRNAQNYHESKVPFSEVGIRATDNLTLVVTLENPTLFFIDVVAFTTYLPVPRAKVEQYGDHWTKPNHIISNGAYRLLKWSVQDRLQFEKNPHYWRKDKVAFNRVDALTVSLASTAFNMYATGQADLVIDKSHIPVTLMAELRQRPDFHANPFLATYFYRFNVTSPPFNDVRIRQAFSMSVDKQRIVDRITRASELPAPTFAPPGVANYTSPEGLSYNPEKARKLLAQAGYPEGHNFPRVNLLYNKGELNEQIAIEIQAMWKEVLGVHVELRNQEWATYLKSLDALDYSLARSSWVGDYNDANTFLDCFVTGRGNNRTGWGYAPYDELMTQANAQQDVTKRMKLLQRAETILVVDQAPILPLYYFVGMMFYDGNKLGGIYPNVVDEHPLHEMYWKKTP